MRDQILGNYLKVHRRRAGLSQRELGKLLGCERSWQVSRHERSRTVPPLLVALAYQEIFQVPVATIFAGMHATVAQVIEKNVAALEQELQSRGGRGHAANGTGQKLQWMTERRRLA